MSDPRESLASALRVAGDVALSRFRAVAVRRKVDGTEVTDADEAVEATLVPALAAAFPEDGIVSEEGARVPGGPAIWWVDPIDGTSAYVDALAHWGPTACRVEGRRATLGGFFLPRLGELWTAERGRGAWRDGVRLSPSSRNRPDSDAVAFVPSRVHRVGPLDWPGRVRALGSTAAHLALVADGRAAAAVVPTWQPWDVGCGLLLLRETGHVVKTLDGRLVSPGDLPEVDGTPFVAGQAAAVDRLLAALSVLPIARLTAAYASPTHS